MKHFLEWVRTYQIIAAVLLVACAWAAWELRTVLAALFGGYVLAAALLPFVDWLSRYIPRAAAAALAFALFIAVIIGAGVVIAVPLQPALQGFISQLQSSANAFTTLSQFKDQLQTLPGAIEAAAVSAAGSTVSFVSLFVSMVVIGAYLCYDWHNIRERAARLFPRAQLTERVIDEQSYSAGSWARGQVALSIIVGGAVYLAALGLSLPYAPALAVAAGILELIPYAGPVMAAVPAVLLAAPDGLGKALFVIAAYVFIQQTENHLLVPLVMERAVNLHPVVVIAAIITGFLVLGFLGALLAVPLVSVCSVTYRELARSR